MAEGGVKHSSGKSFDKRKKLQVIFLSSNDNIELKRYITFD